VLGYDENKGAGNSPSTKHNHGGKVLEYTNTRWKNLQRKVQINKTKAGQEEL
jgi:hypothetical protein